MVKKKMTQKEIKKIAKKNKLRISDVNAKSLKELINENYENYDLYSKGVIVKNTIIKITKNAKRKTIKESDIDTFEKIILFSPYETN